MKIEILQENLTRALGIVSRVISTRPQIPILSHVLMVASDNQFNLTASNTETTIIVPIGAKIDIEGSFTLPARTFQDLVASLPAGKISLENTDSQIKIKSTNFTGKINGTSASEYPPLTPLFNTMPFWEINPQVVISAINKTLFSTATDESRALLTGVIFKVQKGNLTLAATDGFRLSKYDLPEVSLGASSNQSVVVPGKTLSELLKILTEKNESKSTGKSTIKIYFLDNNQILFTVEDIRIYSRLISGSFPDFEKIIPSESTLQIAVSSDELGKAVRLSSIFARESANIIKLSLFENKLKISANAAEVGENESEVDVEIKKGSGEQFQIAFNYRYILDFINSLGKDSKITIDFNTSLNPGIFRAHGEKNFLHLIMPVRVQT